MTPLFHADFFKFPQNNSFWLFETEVMTCSIEKHLSTPPEIPKTGTTWKFSISTNWLVALPKKRSNPPLKNVGLESIFHLGIGLLSWANY